MMALDSTKPLNLLLPSAAVVLWLSVLGGCRPSEYFSLLVTFPDERARESCVSLRVVAMEPGQESGCAPLMGGRANPGDIGYSVEDERFIAPPFSPSQESLKVERSSQRLFFVEGQNKIGETYLRGCNRAVGGDSDVREVVVQLVWVPCVDGVGCDDGNDCTVDVCESGTCSNDPLAAGTPCSLNGGDRCSATCDGAGICRPGGIACSLVNVAEAGCTDGTCTIVRCSAGFGDCNSVDSDGCETKVTADPEHCGACAKVCKVGEQCVESACDCSPGCDLPNVADHGCAGGSCTIVRCDEGFGDCNTAAPDGCETNMLVDSEHCGSCPKACTIVQQCKNGNCEFSSEDLVAYWRLDDSPNTTVSDSSGNSNTGTIFGAKWIDGRSGYGDALQFDGLDDYVTVPKSASLNPSSEITVETWFNVAPGTLADQKPLVQKPYISHVDPYYQYTLVLVDIPTTYPKTAAFMVSVGGVMVDLESKNLNYAYNQWNHLAGTYDGVVVRLYLNGIKVAEQPASGALDAYDTVLQFAAYPNLAKIEENCFGGAMDEVKIFSRALSPEEIAAECSCPAAVR